MSNTHFLSLIALIEPILRPFVAQTVAEVLSQLEADQAQLRDRLWFPESESAALLGLPAHRLRDCRRRGEIVGSKVGKTIGYERGELLRFLRERRAQ